MSNNFADFKETLTVVVSGFLGTISAVAIRRPATLAETICRTIAGITVAITLTGFACELIDITPNQYYKVSAVAVSLGFAGWHVLNIIMVLMDTALEKAKVNKFGFIVELWYVWKGRKPGE